MAVSFAPTERWKSDAPRAPDKSLAMAVVVLEE
jgi:hypothetical protein